MKIRTIVSTFALLAILACGSTSFKTTWKDPSANQIPITGKKVVVVEDVTTTGGSALKAAEALKAEGAEIVRIITIVDRLDGAAETFENAGFKFVPLLTLTDFRK